MTRFPSRRRLVAAILLGLAPLASGGMIAAQTSSPPEDTVADTDGSGSDGSGSDGGSDPTELTPGLPVPDDAGIVHSWALAPGDGSVEAGERPNLSYELAAGGSVDDVVTVYNFSNVQLTFGIYATDAFNNPDGGFNLLPADELPTDVGSWFDLPLDSITLGPGQQASFPIAIRVPVDATPGDHVGALLAASTAVGTGPDNAVISLDRRTGTRVYVRVTGELQAELAVENLAVDYEAGLNPLGGAATVSYQLVNRGNIRLVGTHQVSVAGPLGLHRVSVDPKQISELLPGESIEVSERLDGVWATGLIRARVDVDPATPVGTDQLDATEVSTRATAPPYLVLALLMLVILGGLARRSYVRHRDAPGDGLPAGDRVDERQVEPA